MPRFAYTAKLEPQKVTQGFMEAASEQDVVDKLAAMGYFPVSILPEDSYLYRKKFLSFRKISNRDIVLLSRDLTSLIESGVNIINSLHIVSTQTPNKYLKTVLSDMMDKIKDGKSLSQSLSTHPELFPPMYVSMIHSGEVGGNLDETFQRLADRWCRLCLLHRDADDYRAVNFCYPAAGHDVSGYGTGPATAHKNIDRILRILKKLRMVTAGWCLSGDLFFQADR